MIKIVLLLLLISNIGVINCFISIKNCKANNLNKHKTLIALNAVSFKPIITKLINRQDLSAEETESAWNSILTDEVDPSVIGALLTLLRSKGESPKELAGMVTAMQKACNPVVIDGKLLDIVGTGGDGADTINISTASVILAAACGCLVAKAGNRSVSSRCGSADVLETLGVIIDLSPEQVVQSILKSGIGFMYAPTNHPTMKKVAPVRKSLGVRTAFNMLGPMTNAAKAQRVVIGVFDEELVDKIAGTLIELGHIEHGVIVHGCGLDEISPLGASTIFEIKSSGVDTNGKKKYISNRYLFDPLEVGIERCKIEDLKGGDAEENAQALRDVLEGGEYTNAKRNSVILNAGFGVYVYGLANSIPEGINIARETLYSGKAASKLKEWIEVTQKIKLNSSK